MRLSKGVTFLLFIVCIVLTMSSLRVFLEVTRSNNISINDYRNMPIISKLDVDKECIPPTDGRGIFNHEEWHIDPTKPKKTIKVKIVDFWDPDPTNENPTCMSLCGPLSKVYNLNFTEDPDFVFYSIARRKRSNYKNCVKIFFTGENLVPDFNKCDYALSLSYIDYYGRHFKRSPLEGMKWLYGPFNATRNFGKNMTQRKFCNFIYSDSNKGREGVVARERLFDLLSEYKHVDSPGEVKNNMKDAIEPRNGNWRAGKFEFIKDYKFTIAFENSNSYGYTTEKLTDALFAHTIPIYFGNPAVGLEYNKKAFIHANDYDSLEDVVKKVIELDNDDEAYLAMLNEPPLLYPEYDYDEELLKFFTKIIERGNKPFTKDPLKFSNRL